MIQDGQNDSDEENIMQSMQQQQLPILQQNYQQILQIALLEKNHEQIMNIIKSTECSNFCIQNNIPTIMQNNQSVLQNMGEKLIDLLILMKMLRNEQQTSYFQILKMLLEFIYNSKLLNNDQLNLEKIIGSLLINQIYEFQYYIDGMENLNKENFDNLIVILQNHQMNFKKNKKDKIQEEYLFLFNLFTFNHQNFEKIMQKHKKNWNLQTYQLIDSSLGHFELQELWFNVIIYYWTQYTESEHLKKIINSKRPKNNKICKRNRKYQYCLKLLDSVKNKNDEVQIYWLHREFIYVQQIEQFIDIDDYKKHKSILNNILVDLNNQIETYQNLMNQRGDNFFNYWKYIRKQQYLYLVNTRIFKNQIFELLTIFFWQNDPDVQIFCFLFKNQNKNLIQCLEELQRSQIISSKLKIIQLLHLITEFYNLNNAEFILFKKSFLEFESIQLSIILIEFQQILKQQFISVNNLLYISKLKLIYWFQIRRFFENSTLIAYAQNMLNEYIQNKKYSDKLLFKALKKFLFFVDVSESAFMSSLKILFTTLDQKLFNLINFRNQNQKQPGLQSVKLAGFTLIALRKHINCNLFLKLSYHFKHQFYNLSLFQTFKKYEDILIYYMILGNYYADYSLEEELELVCLQIFKINSDFYVEWYSLEKISQYYCFNPELMRKRQIFLQFPIQMYTPLSHNIFYGDLTDQQLKNLTVSWICDTQNGEKLNKLFPYLISLIKTNRSFDKILSIMNKYIKQDIGPMNEKALFQIIYNNSNYYLRTVLLRVRSQYHSIPFVFQNPICNIDVDDQHHEISEQIYYLLQEWQGFSIISLNFSKQNKRIGKTYLINQIFYDGINKFQICDDCKINEGTIDMALDFDFNGTRQFIVADLHGKAPFVTIKNALWYFQLWIIQIDSEAELQENFDQLVQYLQTVQKQVQSKVCFIVRNSVPGAKKQFQQIIKQIKSQNIAIHYIQDLTKLNAQMNKKELQQAQKFIFDQILGCGYHKRHYPGQQVFYEMTYSFNRHHHTSSQLLIQSTQALKFLSDSLKEVSEQPDGFNNKSVFPQRYYEMQINQKKQEIINGFDLETIEQKLFEIDDLKFQSYKMQHSQLMIVLSQTLSKLDYFNLYICLTQRLKKVNDANFLQLKNNKLQLQNKIQKLNVGRKKSTKLKEQNQKLESIEQQLNNKSFQFGIATFWKEFLRIEKVNPKVFPASRKIYEMISNGESFLFLDNVDQILNEQIFYQIFSQFESQGQERVLIISAIGCENSELDKVFKNMFGCQFQTRTIRCSKGIYFQIIKIFNKEYFMNMFDYIVLLESEGLDSYNSKDMVFDNKTVALLLAVSDIIIINIKGRFHQPLQNLIKMQFINQRMITDNHSAKKQINWVFQQNNEDNNSRNFFYHKLLNLQNEYNDIIQKQTDIAQGHPLKLDIKIEDIQVLGFPFHQKNWKKNTRSGIFESWKQTIPNLRFQKQIFDFGLNKILLRFIIESDNNREMLTLNKVVDKLFITWNLIQERSYLFEYSNVIQNLQNQRLNKIIESLWNQYQQLGESNIPQIIAQKTKEFEILNIQIYNKIQVELGNRLNIQFKELKNKVHQLIQQMKQQREISINIAKKNSHKQQNKLKIGLGRCLFKVFSEINSLKISHLQENGIIQANVLNNIFQTLMQEAIIKGSVGQFLEKPEKISQAFSVLQQNMTYILSQKVTIDQQIFQSYYQIRQLQGIHLQDSYQIYASLYLGIIAKEGIIFVNEFIKDINEKQFNIIDGSQNKKFYLIFKQPLEKRLNLCKKQDFINLNMFYQYDARWVYLEIQTIIQYMKNNCIDDFIDCINISKQKEDKYTSVDNFFRIFECLEIAFSDYAYQNVLNTVKNPGIRIIFNQTRHINQIKEAFSLFLKTLKYNFKKRQIQISKEIIRQHSRLQTISKQYQAVSMHYIQEDKSLLLKQEIIIINEKIKLNPVQNDLKEYFLFIQNSDAKNENFQQFRVIFHKLMKKFMGWSKLYLQIYELIKSKLEYNDNPTFYDKKLESIIFFYIERKIETFNEQFARFGLILSQQAIDSINYFSRFMICRFLCLRNYQQIQKETNAIMGEYTNCYRYFRSMIISKFEGNR